MKNINFTTIDVETASDDSTICQIGIAKFENGILVDKWMTYVNPETNLFTNTYAHDITYNTVVNTPTFDKIYSILKEKTDGEIVIHHMPFVKLSLRLACEKYNLPFLDYETWIDSAKMVRRTYMNLAKSGFGLFHVAEILNIPLTLSHHDALQDAIITGKIALKCMYELEPDLLEWFNIVKTRITPHSYNQLILEGNPDGELYGENIVFTGTLSMPRKEAATLAAQTGCSVKESVTKETTILVIGVPNLTLFKDMAKSSKQRKAEKLIAEGQYIQLVYEHDFINLLKMK